jgi:hypothetical protein
MPIPPSWKRCAQNWTHVSCHQCHLTFNEFHLSLVSVFPGGLACITKDDLPLPVLGDYDDGYDSDIDDDDEGATEDASSMVPAQVNEVEKSA